MKISTLFVLLFCIGYFSANAETTSLESVSINVDHVAVDFENNDREVVLVFNDTLDRTSHTVIDIQKITDLEYKTRVMRYFGGLLVNESYHFSKLIVISNGERFVYHWTRKNVSTVVNKMVHRAETGL